MFTTDPNRRARWYFGGVAGSMAVCFTHPLDLLKVHLQTQTERGRLVPMAVKVIKNDGFLALYSGLSAAVLRQMTYTITRFGAYETMKGQVDMNSFTSKILVAGSSGFIGGIVGTPADLVNVRMQHDMKLPAEQRRNYKHAIDGIIQIGRQEGFKGLMGGWYMASARGFMMTVGQIAFYDQTKQSLIKSGYFSDNIATHFTASITAGAIATGMTQPFDVMKTRLMNAAPGEYRGVVHCAMIVAKSGPQGFFKGFVPAFVRLCPHTILLWLFLEQLRLRVGWLPEKRN